jgi:estrone sulfotransferase
MNIRQITSNLRENIFRKNKIKIYQDDTFLVSYPKSGNTWMRFFLINYLYNKNNRDVNYSELEYFIPSVHNSSRKELRNKSRPRIIKTHYIEKRYPKILYVVRDGRDALVSYYHYLIQLKGFKGNFNDFYFSNIHKGVGLWHEHVQKALDLEKSNTVEILIIRYEDLLDFGEASFRKVIDFLKIDFDDERLKFAIQNSSFISLKKTQEREGVIIEDKQINFFRNGKTQQWKDYFSQEIFVDFMSRSKRQLIELRYNDEF